jgi:acyl-CoA thioesterase-1
MRILISLCAALLVASVSTLPARASVDAAPFTYVAIGASDTVGVGAADPDRDGWVPRLANLLGSETRVVNLGVSGALLEDALQGQVPAALASDPDLVTLWMGVNDFNALVPLSVYATQLDTALRELREKTQARILVGNLPDLSRVTVYANVLAFLGIDPAPVRREVARWNAAIDQVTTRHGATLVDLHAEWSELAQHPEYVSADGFHPSAVGYARLAELFHAAAVPVLS